jgi:hypothetical protein
MLHDSKSLVGSWVIDAELGRENHGSILHNCDREGAEITYAKIDPRTRLN